MGQSSKQVSSKPPSMKRRPYQQQQQDSEPLKCPRCYSINTKFCYFNNYNESQPRHYCRACKRHWTEGGTLRNVPVGGGHKHRRTKKTTASSPTIASATASNANTSTSTTPTSRDSKLISHMATQTPQQMLHLTIVPGGTQKSFLYQPLIHGPSLMPQYDSTNACDLEDKFYVGTKNSLFVGASAASDLPLHPQNHCLQFPFSSSSYCDTNLSSFATSFQSSNVYDNGDEFKTIDEPTITSMIMSNACGNHAQTWKVPILELGVDMPSSWNWDYIDSLVSTDLSTSFQDTDVKP